ncbi:hypothetical protein H4R20_007378 [Coemansia guatemalensis]|uniref:Uncharacterized protein n=1 Tax=Coemansia guatemalensis TaxID=2761395 RepID=A0A9W8HNZ5_9FUNG|nr:hypothetical protein H4R20_007378 [Coemansia guatemalensis]
MSTSNRTPALSNAASLAKPVVRNTLTGLTAQEAAVYADHCVTIIIPQVYSGAIPAKNGFVDESAFSADVAQLLADDIYHAQNRHTMLMLRLIERISEAGWDVQYRRIIQQVECMEIAISPSSGVTTASSFEAILCDWGIDISLLGAKVDNPRVNAGAADTASSACSSL